MDRTPNPYARKKPQLKTRHRKKHFPRAHKRERAWKKRIIMQLRARGANGGLVFFRWVGKLPHPGQLGVRPPSPEKAVGSGQLEEKRKTVREPFDVQKGVRFGGPQRKSKQGPLNGEVETPRAGPSEKLRNGGKARPRPWPYRGKGPGPAQQGKKVGLLLRERMSEFKPLLENPPGVNGRWACLREGKINATTGKAPRAVWAGGRRWTPQNPETPRRREQVPGARSRG